MVENGTACVLRCTFKSNEVVSSHITVTWNFQSSQPDNQFSKAPYAVRRERGGGRRERDLSPGQKMQN